MTDDAPLHHRRTIRLSGWDYSADAVYFVTVCTNDRSHLFGEIVDNHMRVNILGAVVVDSWRWLASQYAHVTLDDWCLMPNHLHGLLILTGRGGSRTAPTDSAARGGDVVMTPRKPVGRLIGAFKTVSTRHINRLRNTPAAVVWQRNFWDHIVRDDREMDLIRAYIRDNPTNWSSDGLNNA